MSDYLVILRPERSAVPAPRRLARALKFALRGCRLRCVHLEEIEPGDVAGVIGAAKRIKAAAEARGIPTASYPPTEPGSARSA